MTLIIQRYSLSRSAQHIIALQIVDIQLFRPLRRHPPPEWAQQLSLHSEGIRLLSGGKVVINIAEQRCKFINTSCSGMTDDINNSMIFIKP